MECLWMIISTRRTLFGVRVAWQLHKLEKAGKLLSTSLHRFMYGGRKWLNESVYVRYPKRPPEQI